MGTMSDTEVIEILCNYQDLNKWVRLQAETDEQMEQCERIENNINNQFRNLYVN